MLYLTHCPQQSILPPNPMVRRFREDLEDGKREREDTVLVAFGCNFFCFYYEIKVSLREAKPIIVLFNPMSFS